MRDLLDEDDDADGREHALDDTARKVLADYPGSGDAQHQLGQTADDDGEEEGLKTDFLDAVVDNHSQARRWARYPDMAA